jgi:histidyl-tRNA synthetase
MEKLGLKGHYVVKVNNRKVLDGVMESIELGGEENAGRRLTVLRAIDKLDKFPKAEVQKLLGPGRWDGGEEGKGDFTKGADLDVQQIEAIFLALNFKFEFKQIEEGISLDRIEGEFPNRFVRMEGKSLIEAGRSELGEIHRLVRAAGYGEDRIRIDSSVIRGLEYYTGPVFEVELTLETKDEKGRTVRFGSVGGGGRYDGLVSRFRAETVPATGFSIGVSRLQAALTMLGKLDTKQAIGPVIVTVFGGEIAGYQKMVATLRSAGIRAELYLGNPKHSLGQQMKYADRRDAPCAIIQGSDEKTKGKIQIKDLIQGSGLTGAKDREEYLKKQTEAQVEVDETRLVDEVRKVLVRHGVGEKPVTSGTIMRWINWVLRLLGI